MPLDLVDMGMSVPVLDRSQGRRLRQPGDPPFIQCRLGAGDLPSPTPAAWCVPHNIHARAKPWLSQNFL